MNKTRDCEFQTFLEKFHFYEQYFIIYKTTLFEYKLQHQDVQFATLKEGIFWKFLNQF